MTRKRRLLWQLYPGFLFVALLSIVSVTWYAGSTLKTFDLNQTSRDLEARARLVEDRILSLLSPLDSRSIDALCKSMGKRAETRITVIGPDGTVYGDSDHDPLTMDNHGTRPEVKAALQNGTGKSIRFSRTLQKKLMYRGIAVHKDGAVIAVIRTSIPVDNVDAVLLTIQGRIAVAGLFIVLISAALSFLVSRRMSKPLEDIRQVAAVYSKGDFSARLPAFKVRELDEIAQAMKAMANGIQDRIKLITMQRNELNTILSSMREGVIAVDLEGRILSINDGAGRLFKTDPRKVTGMTVEELSRNPRLSGFVGRALGEEDAFEEDMTLRAGNEDRIVHLRSTALRDSEGKRVGILLVLADVTHVRKLENVRRDFVANVSHEIKTPLTAVKGFVETLRDGALENPEDAYRFLGIIERHTRRLEAMVEDLLTLSKIEQEGDIDKAAHEEFVLRNILSAAIQLCQSKAAAKRVSVELNCPEQLLTRGNAGQLEQAVVNLLDNAIAYSPEGSTIRVSAQDEDGGTRISVADEGYGIAPEHIPRIFERFYRVDKGRSRAAGGTGLGLAIVKHIAQVHGGEVSVQSTPGKGSTFTIRFGGRPPQEIAKKRKEIPDLSEGADREGPFSC
jgi:two-component system, OmpR family, phosphate regulon sensor histidine kinase PhoR